MRMNAHQRETLNNVKTIALSELKNPRYSRASMIPDIQTTLASWRL